MSKILTLASIFISAGTATWGHAEPPHSAQPVAAPLSQLLWRGVEAADGSYSGSIADVLVDMPTGRMLYVVIDRDAPFHYQKAVSPERLTRNSDGDYRCSLSLSQWLATPILDGTGTRVERFVDARWEILGYAEPAWTRPRPRRTPGLEVMAPAPGQPRAAAFVSLQRLRAMNVDSIGRDAIGSIAGYLVDWPRHRVTHVLIAPPRSSTPTYAIPVLRLMPRIGEGGSLFVNVEPRALQQAPLADASAASRFPQRIFRYRAPGAVASDH